MRATILAAAFVAALTTLACKKETAPAPAPASAPATETTRVRQTAVAGSWYPGNRARLSGFLDDMLDAAKAPELKTQDQLRALIAPHAGYRFSGAVAATGYRLLRKTKPRRVIVIGPAHRVGFRGLSIADVTHYRTPLGDIPLDTEAIARLRNAPLVTAHPRAHTEEHSIEMQLPMLQRALADTPEWKLVPILVGQLGPAELIKAAALIRPLADDRTLVVASGDFTHFGPNYGYQPFAADADVQDKLRSLDMGAFDRIAARDPEGFIAYRSRTGITACGFGPVTILLHLLTPASRASLLRYDTSGAITKSFTNSVSYLSVGVFSAKPLSAATPPDAYVKRLDGAPLEALRRLALSGLKHAVEGGAESVNPEAIASEIGLTAPLRRIAGAFVTLEKQGRLRGCIGTIEPIEPLYRAVIGNASNAALRDRRFTPVTRAELPQLEVEVSVLSPIRRIASPQEFKVGTHGIIIEKNGRRAVYLPSVPIDAGGWSREETLSHLSEKAGLPPDGWRNGASFSVFTAEVYAVTHQSD